MKWSNWKYKNTCICVFSVWPLPKVENLFRKQIWSENIYITILKKNWAFRSVFKKVKKWISHYIFELKFFLHTVQLKTNIQPDTIRLNFFLPCTLYWGVSGIRSGSRSLNFRSQKKNYQQTINYQNIKQNNTQRYTFFHYPLPPLNKFKSEWRNPLFTQKKVPKLVYKNTKIIFASEP